MARFIGQAPILYNAAKNTVGGVRETALKQTIPGILPTPPLQERRFRLEILTIYSIGKAFCKTKARMRWVSQAPVGSDAAECEEGERIVHA